MPAEYTTMQDDTLTLTEGGDIDKEIRFTVPGVDTGEAANLAFRVDPSGDATLRVRINGTTVLEQSFDTAPQRVWHENFSGSILQAGTNTLKVTKVGAGTGDLHLSDFIVHYKRV